MPRPVATDARITSETGCLMLFQQGHIEQIHGFRLCFTAVGCELAFADSWDRSSGPLPEPVPREDGRPQDRREKAADEQYAGNSIGGLRHAGPREIMVNKALRGKAGSSAGQRAAPDAAEPLHRSRHRDLQRLPDELAKFDATPRAFGREARGARRLSIVSAQVGSAPSRWSMAGNHTATGRGRRGDFSGSAPRI